MASVVVTHPTSAAFREDIENGPNVLDSGTVQLTNDSAGSFFANLADLGPGDSGAECIKLVYKGSLPASSIRMYADTGADSGLGNWLKFTVDLGTSGPAASRSCNEAPSFGGAIVNLASAVQASRLPTDFADGYLCGSNVSANQNAWFRIAYTLDVATPDSAQGTSIAVKWVWEARS
ncbi:hypothetical protein ACQP2F_15845 [Actinoplanes sp. CA-030573]|uniref:hypothetical protein n=1 Tax=Actinoplanes sp. CA-030573 TaxID=3239898 RepID=UPI003D924405